MNDYQIFKNMQKHILLDETAKEYLISSLKIREVLKKEFILKQRQTCKKLYFVESDSLGFSY